VRCGDIWHGRHSFWVLRLLIVDIARFGPPAHGQRDVGTCCVILEGCRYVDCEEGGVAVTFAVALKHNEIC
jgi:hypothetical protein